MKEALEEIVTILSEIPPKDLTPLEEEILQIAIKALEEK